MRYLRENTATRITIGPFYDVTDGITPEIALTVTNDWLTFIVDDAGVPTLVLDVAPTASGGANDMVHVTSDIAGYYDLELAAANVNYTGRAMLSIHDTDVHLPVFHEFQIVSANVYDSLFTDGDLLDVNAAQHLGTAYATPTTAGVPEVELARISGQTVTAAAAVTVNAELGASATAMDAFEDQYDGTGLTGETYPSSQAQVGNLATGSAAISVVAESDTVTTGGETNTYAVTDEVDGVHHEITDVAGAMELYYQFDVSGNGVAATVQYTGRLTSANDSIGVYAYNWGGASWDQIGTLAGTGGTTDGVEIFNLLTRHTGTGVNLGKVRVRGYAASGLTSATLYIDQAIVSYAVVAQSVGYANGAIWFDSNASNTNTEVYVDGTADNPVSTEAAVNTLIASTGLSTVRVAIDSTITFATAHTSEHWIGEHWTAALGGQDLSGAHFTGADVSGVGTGTSRIDFTRCSIGTATIHQFHMTDCGYNGTLTLGEAGNYVINNGHSSVAGATTPIIDTGAAIANVNLAIPDWHNGLEVRNLNAAGTDLFSISGIGQIVYAASSSGAVNQRGRFKVTNTGGVTITYDDPSQNEIDILADTNELQTNQGNWLTATGFSTHSASDVTTDIDANSTQLAAILADTASIGVTKNATFSNFEFLMVDETDHVTPETGLTVTGQMSIDGAAFAAVNGAIAEVSNGIYQIDLTADDTNGDVITYRFSSAGAADRFVTIKTRA